MESNGSAQCSDLHSSIACCVRVSRDEKEGRSSDPVFSKNVTDRSTARARGCVTHHKPWFKQQHPNVSRISPISDFITTQRWQHAGGSFAVEKVGVYPILCPHRGGRKCQFRDVRWAQASTWFRAGNRLGVVPVLVHEVGPTLNGGYS